MDFYLINLKKVVREKGASKNTMYVHFSEKLGKPNVKKKFHFTLKARFSQVRTVMAVVIEERLYRIGQHFVTVQKPTPVVLYKNRHQASRAGVRFRLYYDWFMLNIPFFLYAI